MNSIVKKYSNVFKIWEQTEKKLSSVDKKENMLNLNIKQFADLVNSNAPTINLFSGVQKHISYFLDTYSTSTKFNSTPIKSALLQISDLKKKINVLKAIIKKINPYQDRYDKSKVITIANEAIIICKTKMTLANIKQHTLEIDNALTEVKNVEKKYQQEIESLQSLQQQLKTNNNLWNEHFIFLQAKLEKYLKEAHKKDYVPNEFTNAIQSATKEKQKIIQISEKYLGKIITNYRKEFDTYKTERLTLKAFNALRKKITQQEAKKINAEIIKLETKIKQITPCKNRYNKDTIIKQAIEGIKSSKSNIKFETLLQEYSRIEKINNEISILATHYHKEIDEVKGIKKNLKTNINIWQENFLKLDQDLNSYIQIVNQQDFKPQFYKDLILKAEQDKKELILDYEASLGKYLFLYQTEINVFKTQRLSLSNFDRLRAEIERKEEKRKKWEKRRFLIVTLRIIGILILLGIFIWLYFK